MPAPKRKSLAQKGNAHAKKQQVGHGQSSGASNSNEPMDGATREPMRTAVPIRPTPPAGAERCLCRAAEPLTHPMASHERSLDFGRALCGLRVELPYAGWGGEYALSTQVAMGVVIKYDGRYQLFDIRFPAELQSADVKGLNWAQLFGEEQWSCGAYLAFEQKHWTADMLTEQPRGRPPAGAACWDMRRAEYVRSDGSAATATASSTPRSQQSRAAARVT